MRYYDKREAQKLNAKQWQIDLLKLNPDYVSWGPYEDYMWKEEGGWDSRQIFPTWSEFGPWQLNDLNECVNFYFSVIRASEECSGCGGNGYHFNAQKIVNSFYAYSSEDSTYWCDKITQDELEALIAENRIPKGTSLEQVNKKNHPGAKGIGHDAINRHILISARLKRLGIPERCLKCGGDGYIYTEPDAHVVLTFWILHPRKGCSRGIEISKIEKSDLSAVIDFLKRAAKRNAQRFAKVVEYS